MASENSPQENSPKRGFRKVFLGCLVLPILLFFSYQLITNLLIQSRVEALNTEIAAVKAESKRRPVLFGVAVPGNAVHDYQAIEWMTESRDSWKNSPPNHLPRTDYGQDFFSNQVFDVGKHSSILYRYAVMDSSIPYSEIELKDAKAFYKQYGNSLIRHVREGLKKESSDWSSLRELGTFAFDVNFEVYHRLVDLMIYQATLENPEQQLKGILQALSFSVDLEIDFWSRRRAWPSNRMRVHAALQQVLQKSLSQSQLENLLDCLDRIGPPNEKRMLLTEIRSIDCAFAGYAGYPVRPLTKEEEGSILRMEVPASFQIKAVFLREWVFSDDYLRQFINLSDLTLSARRKREQELNRQLNDSWTVFGKGGCLNSTPEFDVRTETEIHFDFVRIGAAARIFQLKTGAWPTQASELKNYFKKGVPKDPITDLKKDYQFSKSGDDLVISTANSPYPEVKSASFKLLQKTKSN